ncbi:6-carboxytetrahydropterin synthase [Candidatus Kirkpatrickella diaphorinae]|uniref:6-carboxy-5,6,7,8-tetrahydropterin synthase n=1 Tax=Candidatus Kirkpatrickella diaphorinae TaxID=2984322 RepID=A0ABY6GIS0_9PROT|nr:6-carboxytetrahydropterin synthase [Candidatus Kirkpatrickella diaphorinae]UYH50740.1 6-carboxytetrahydropterin synthase [Candidatus Kirkpatrickella diaphorinae]
MLELQFTRRFSMGHRLLSDAAPRCAIPHGHNEYVTVAIRARNATALDGRRNMMAAFADVKRRWHHFIDTQLDHALQLGEGDDLLNWFATHEPENYRRIVVTPGDPTTELMAALLMAKINSFLEADMPELVCHHLTLRETETNAVSISGPVEDVLPKLDRPRSLCWWWRADDTISNAHLNLRDPD